MAPRFFLFATVLLMPLAACNKPADPVLPPPPVPQTSAPALLPSPIAKAEAASRNVAMKVGGDSDAHGCKASAGYSWSQLQEKCLRLFESGKRLDFMATGAQTEGPAAYVIFDKAEARAELFLPDEKASLILESRGAEGEQSWEAGEYRLIPWKGYVLQKNGQAIYAGE
ncbi:MAG: hypothetical protein ACRERR_00790 [Moraxellaceae bacterium]